MSRAHSVRGLNISLLTYVKVAKIVKARDTLDVALFASALRASLKNEVSGIAGYISSVSFQIVRPTF